jgi:hypothetical protein
MEKTAGCTAPNSLWAGVIPGVKVASERTATVINLDFIKASVYTTCSQSSISAKLVIALIVWAASKRKHWGPPAFPLMRECQDVSPLTRTVTILEAKSALPFLMNPPAAQRNRAPAAFRPPNL